jgi:pilus assembly protein Flp/PilA
MLSRLQTGKEVKNMFLSKEKGQGLIEYALIIVLVSIVVIVVLALLGPAISNIFQQIIDTI